ncbi:MAG: hypothetical protein ACK4N5_05915 [Myxococcales bacterium]
MSDLASDPDLPPHLQALLDKGRAQPKAKKREPEPAEEREPTRSFTLAVLGLAVVLGLLAIRAHWIPNKWLFGDGAFYMNVSRGILENFSLRQETLHPHSWYDRDLGWNRNVDAAWSNIALGRNGEWWPKHPILMPILATPFIWAFGPIGSLIFHFIFYALIGVFAFRIAARVASRPAALAAACAFVATPWVYDRAWGFNNDVFYSVLILAALDAALGGRGVLAGALLGIGVFAKATNVLYGPALLLVFVLRKDYRNGLRFIVAAAIPAVLYLGLNWYMYGSPLRTGYDRILVRVNGQLSTHSHAKDFHWSNLRGGLQNVLFGSEGFLGRFPLLFPALAGLLLLLARRWREGLVLGWCIAVPIVFHAPYTWYRLEFNLPQAAFAVAPLAALLPPFGRPAELDEGGPMRVRWDRLALVLLVVVLGVSGGVRRVLARGQDYFFAHLPRATVLLGDIPCDYFNNQVERWECTQHDRSDWHMTGRALEPTLKFGGKAEKLLLLHPHPSGRERKLEYQGVPMGQRLSLRYGLEDSSKADATVRFRVLVDGRPLLDEEVTGKGLKTKELDTSAFAGRDATVTLVTSSPSADWAIFAVDGGPR